MYIFRIDRVVGRAEVMGVGSNWWLFYYESGPYFVVMSPGHHYWVQLYGPQAYARNELFLMKTIDIREDGLVEAEKVRSEEPGRGLRRLVRQYCAEVDILAKAAGYGSELDGSLIFKRANKRETPLRG